MDYDDLDDFYDEDEESELINYEEITKYAMEGLKNPVMIAHAMGHPVKWFIDSYKEQVDLAIERGLALLALETTRQIKENARSGDFQAQKYILQNIDDSWSDRKEIVNRNEIDIKGLPSLREMFNAGIEHKRPETKPIEKEINPRVIEGEVIEVPKK